MSSPYSGATPVGTPQGGQDPYGEANYAVAPDQAYGGHSGTMGTPTTAEGRPDIEGTSVGQLFGELAKDLSTLMRQEVALAKAEVQAEAKKAGKGVGLMVYAGLAGFLTLLFLSHSLMWFLDNLMDTGLAGLIVAVLWGIAAAVGLSMGRKALKQVNPKPERTVDTLSEVPGALKPH
ncbi:phage holin family protein [Geodermatophilus sp. DSM 44513]|uniref:phage holin family protein n=1 Tax=Geodermatophilus sp. DSM 44513 TaxID=1528104 RepID=UPI001281E666|nr:phage holin family protein [Geodermatophilus sp. DSM 44513]WNV76731.1 phage holin family protein [Geodermatophilus sp. DSM 44513]